LNVDIFMIDVKSKSFQLLM